MHSGVDPQDEERAAADARAALDGFGPATRAWFEESFDGPTRVQREGWPIISSGEHTLLLAPTGSGKTLAAFLSCIDRLCHRDPAAKLEPGVRALYISPLKALVYDIERNLQAPLVGIERTAARLGVPIRSLGVDVRTGDTPSRERQRMARRPGDVLVTTPESLYLILTSQARDILRTVQTVILDEIHVMAGTKRGVHLALSLERLSTLCGAQKGGREPQRIGLSATQRPLDVVARYLGGDRPVRVVDTSEPPRLELSVKVPVDDMDQPPRPIDLDQQRLKESPDGRRRTPMPRVATRLTATDHTHGNTRGDDDAPAEFEPGRRTSMAMEGGIWPSVYPRLLEIIRAHRSTIIFVNSRLLCERLAQKINEVAALDATDDDEAPRVLVRTHHGSLSHEARKEVEEALKGGHVPALIATSSLELGIDMGTVDHVVLVESPGTAARGLQRVGRAGHGVGQTSLGTVFPKFKGDLLECAVVSSQMLGGEIEATRPPKNCLDVLSQQLVAMISMDDWTVPELYQCVRRATPFAELSREVFDATLDMLAGRYPSDAFADLAPRLNWNRTTDALEARRGARMTAVLNGGTIPDRGLYTVHLGGGEGDGQGGTRLGELDEEMVYETRAGDVLILGASSWRVEDITRDRVYVTPAPGQPGRLPFWRGERPGRPIELGRAIGAFLDELSGKSREEASTWLRETTVLDERAIKNLLDYVSEQLEVVGCLPTSRAITVERFRDELGDWRICILTPFGSRVHAPWAMALESLLSVRAGFDVDLMWTDDGIALRLADVDELPDAMDFFVEPDQIEDLIVEQLQHSAMFATRFRENAARALLLPKRRARQRTPLWLQRRKAQTLQAVATQHPSFPIVLETYRECLQDVFDLDALGEVMAKVQRREIRVDDVEARTASPFARSLVFQYIANYLYDGDQPLAERKAAALALDRNLLRELLGQEELRDLLDLDAVEEVEAELQWLTDERKARHADAAHDLLRRLGDLTLDELRARCEGDPLPWLDKLALERRVIETRVGNEARYIAVEDAGRFRDALGVAIPQGIPDVFLDRTDAPLESLLMRYARTHGPFLTEAPAERFGLQPAVVEELLRALQARGALVVGEMRPGGTRREWCEPDVLRRLKRRSLAKLRKQVAPVDDEVYARFLPSWHGIGGTRTSAEKLLERVEQLEGLALPYSTLVDEILPSRVQAFHPRLLDELGAMGALVWVGAGSLGKRDGKIRLYRREQVPFLLDAPAPLDDDGPDRDVLDGLGPDAREVLGHLSRRGACFFAELERVVEGLRGQPLLEVLWDLVWAGFITNDTFQPLKGLRVPGGARSRRVGRVHGLVDIGAECHRLAPEAHRAGGVQALCFAERAHRLGVVETVVQHEALVEVAL